jgi:hypothetical protein
MSDTIKTRPQSKEWDEGYTRTFGDRRPTRGRWVWDAAAGKLVPADEYVRPESTDAKNAPIMVDRFYEGTISPIDGSDIGSRAKHKEHMRIHGVASRTDFSPEFRERVKKERDREDSKKRRAAMEQAKRHLYSQGKLR